MGLMDKIKGMMLERSDEPEGGFGLGDPAENPYDKTKLLEMFRKAKKESFENRWIWERTWMRNIHYINNRHWIEYIRQSNEWRNVKLAKWFPKPVTNKIGEGLQALRAMFTSVNIGVNVRPVGGDPKNIAVAAVSDELAPLLHEEHEMDDVMNEHDFWFIATGNAFIHTFFERDMRHGATVIPFEQCLQCKTIMDSPAIADAGGVCECGSNQFQPAMDPETGEPMEKRVPKGKGVTAVLSPFELIFPNASYARFADVPYVIRLRWRSRSYYENHPVLGPQVKGFAWSKAPSEQALQLFRSLPYHNDMGVAPFLGGAGESEEGAAEYEMWVRPCDEYPEGCVFRVLGDGEPVLLELEDEAIPGPLPYVDAAGQPVFTFEHSAFEQRGGRVYGTSPFDSVIQKQNQLNQLDAFVLMIINRMSNPLWLVPKGAEVEKFTGEPGLVVKWNPLTVGGNAKPERIDGLGPNASLFQIREQYLRDIEEGLGTYDVLKGSKPAGVESFSGLQLMVERGQSRFASAFKSRGNLYKSWFRYALEIEREFGPDTRTATVLSPARTWTQKQFKNAQLQGSFGVVVEDGSNTPKTTLGIRAAVEHLNTLGFLDPNDPDQKYKVFQLFGQSGLSPALDIHMQAALRKQQAFEEWAADDAAQQKSFAEAQQKMADYAQSIVGMQPEPGVPGPDGVVPPAAPVPPPPSINATTPLAWKPWYSAPIHKQEFLKWANSDRMIELMASNPALEQLMTAHLLEIDTAMAPPPMPGEGPGPKPGGGMGQAMKNSNQESGGAQNDNGGHAGPRQ
jgi:hypothetical protein